MTGNDDLLLTAEGLVVAHGNRAVRECEAIIAKMVERGDRLGQENWTRILAALRELQSADRESGAA
jgi:hypothetical protein